LLHQEFEYGDRPGHNFVFAAGTSKVDWRDELAVVIGVQARSRVESALS